MRPALAFISISSLLDVETEEGFATGGQSSTPVIKTTKSLWGIRKKDPFWTTSRSVSLLLSTPLSIHTLTNVHAI